MRAGGWPTTGATTRRVYRTRGPLVDGVYVMTNRNSGKALTVEVSPTWAAARVRIDAEMVLTEAGDQDGFGVYLSRTGGGDYVFAMYPAEAWIRGPGVDCQAQSPVTDVRGGDIALSGEYDSVDNVTTLTGYLDGQAVVTCVDDGFDTDGSGELRDPALVDHLDDGAEQLLDAGAQMRPRPQRAGHRTFAAEGVDPSDQMQGLLGWRDADLATKQVPAVREGAGRFSEVSLQQMHADDSPVRALTQHVAP